MSTQDNSASAVADRAAGLRPQPAMPSSRSSIPSADYKAMRKICDAAFTVAFHMPTAELVAAMRGFYATSETNCPWYAYSLRHAMPVLLATIGSDRADYEAAWNAASAIEAASAGETSTGSTEGKSAVRDSGDAL